MNSFCVNFERSDGQFLYRYYQGIFPYRLGNQRPWVLIDFAFFRSRGTALSGSRSPHVEVTKLYMLEFAHFGCVIEF